MRLPIVSPITIAHIPRMFCIRQFPVACSHLALSIRWFVSNMYAEKVVNAPKKPAKMIILTCGLIWNLFWVSAHRSPKRRQPIMFTAAVPRGKWAFKLIIDYFWGCCNVI